MNVFSCYNDGAVLTKDVVGMSPDTILSSFKAGVKNLAAISLETGYTTKASVPYAITNAFKNLAAIGMEVDYKFKALEDAMSGAGSAGAAPAGGAK
jgi:large subunit ribosomal protein LP0